MCVCLIKTVSSIEPIDCDQASERRCRRGQQDDDDDDDEDCKHVVGTTSKVFATTN